MLHKLYEPFEAFEMAVDGSPPETRDKRCKPLKRLKEQYARRPMKQRPFQVKEGLGLAGIGLSNTIPIVRSSKELQGSNLKVEVECYGVLDSASVMAAVVKTVIGADRELIDSLPALDIVSRCSVGLDSGFGAASAYVDPIVDTLDANYVKRNRLSRAATRYHDGKHYRACAFVKPFIRYYVAR
ncbi:hypothetical protein Tco_0525100 [Tanacetum coccineum]